MHCRSAVEEDIPSILQMLLDDDIAQMREGDSAGEDVVAYHAAFQDIVNDPNNDLLVAEVDGKVVGFLQVTVIPGISYHGARRCQIEDMRVAKDSRRQGIGRQLIESAKEWAEVRGCTIIELFMHASRKDAAAFYESLGFESEHRGYRMQIPAG